VTSDGPQSGPYAIIKDLMIAARNAAAKLRPGAAKNLGAPRNVAVVRVRGLRAWTRAVPVRSRARAAARSVFLTPDNLPLRQ
jgi:hypothetical protein